MVKMPEENELPAEAPGRAGAWIRLTLALAAGVCAFRNRAYLERQLERRVLPYVKAGAAEARSSGSELLAQAGVVERPRTGPLPPQGPSAESLSAPESTVRYERSGAGEAEALVRKDRLRGRSMYARVKTGGSPGDDKALYARRSSVAKEGGGAEHITQHMGSSWKGYAEAAVPFWKTELGIGLKWSASFAAFFFVLGTLLFRTDKNYVRVSAHRHPGKWK